MMMTDMGDSLVVRHFREFYHEVIKLKRLAGIAHHPDVEILRGEHAETADAAIDISAIDVAAIDAAAIDGVSVNEIRNRLIELLEHQQRAAARFGGDYMILYDDARYVMVALADEIFLHSDWHGRVTWNFSLVEDHFYHTHIAGELFFQRVDRHLLAQRDTSQVELAKIYLMALCLGFQGKYRGVDHGRELERYRRRLYSHIFGREDRAIDEAKSIFPRAHDFTLVRGERKLLPPLRRWIWRFVIVLAVALATQHVVWNYGLTDDMWTIVRQIISEEEA